MLKLINKLILFLIQTVILSVAEVSIAGLKIVKTKIEKKVKKNYIIKLIKIKKIKILNINTSFAVKQTIFRKIDRSPLPGSNE